ncbi:hypothetical protein PENSPDRAFT_693017 [Peniophora sp. CONT]|nr:hypothetical protein PENSPDRAFT_693017 [Peniophora sp. CONT]
MGDRITQSSAETALVEQIFAKNDSQGFGVITGDVAVGVFGGSKLPSTVLGEIWSLADNDNKGFLDKQGVAVAIRLIGHAQAGRQVSEALLRQPGPPATIEGYAAPPVQARSPPPKPPSRAPGLPLLTPQDKAKFARLFQGCGPQNGLLSGDKARDVFVKSKLPVDKLSAIWSLSDTKGRGALDQTDFTIAMYMIQALMSNSLTFVPTTLPPGLYEQASPDGVASHSTGGSFNRASMLVPQSTGPISTHSTGLGARPPPPVVPPRAQSQFIPAFPGVPQQQADTRPWDVTPQEKANSDKFFDELDKAKRGYIDGDTAVPFLLLSKLPGDQLAQVWDLADLSNDGRLTREGFAVAMHLIQSKLAGNDLPTTLPQTLIPPSMRAAHASQPQQQQPLAPVHELSDLLFGDDEPPASKSIVPQSTGTPLQPQGTGGYSGGVLQPQNTGQFRSPLQPQSTGARSPPPHQVNTPLTHQTTGGPFGTAQQPQGYGSPAPLSQQGTGVFGQNFSPSPFVIQQPQQQQPDPFGGAGAGQERDLFDDDEPQAAAAPHEDKSAEIGNAQNQLNSTNRSLEITKSERADVESRLAEQAAQLSALQSQLAAAKTSYETETKVLAALRERFSNQTAEIAEVRRALITAESELSSVRVEKAEVEQGVLRDKEEVRELQRRMAETGAAIETTKAETEKAKKEAKQQRGLHAIAKKQLATREAERVRAAEELAAAQADAKDAARERIEAETELASEPVAPVPVVANGNGYPAPPERSDSVAFAAAHALPGTPASIGSPASTISRNPFDRLTAQHTGGSLAPQVTGSGSPPRTESPFLPFTAGSLPSSPPPAAPAAPATDPFGFEQAFNPTVPVETNQAPADPNVTEAPTEAVPMPGAFSPVAEANKELAELAPGPEADKPTTDAPTGEEIAMPPPQTDVLVSPSSEGGDLFSTPPTKPADGSRMSTFEDAFGTGQFPPLDGPAPHFPPVDSNGEIEREPPKPQAHTDEPLDTTAHTDLGANLMELEVNESDSSDDEDNRPLSTIIAAKKPAEAITNGEAPQISFDDAFGQPFNPPAPTGGSPFEQPAGSGSPFESAAAASSFEAAPTQDTSSSAFDDAFGSTAPPKSPDGGKSAFDEALGKLPASESAAPSSFGFDNGFEDSFDFGSAAAAAPSQPAALAPAPASTDASAGSGFFPPPPNGHARHSMLPPQNESPAAAPANASTFDSVFAPAADSAPKPNPFAPAQPVQPAPAAWTPTAAPESPAAKPEITQSESQRLGISFDDAFGGQTPSQALNLDQFGSTSSRSTAATNASATTTGTTPQEFTRATSPRRSNTRDSISIASPGREGTASPPPRVSSPTGRPRPSTASSKEDTGLKPEKGKEQKHSKLSIRLPFGRKKNKGKAGAEAEAPPVPGGSHLTPVLDEGAVPIVPPTEAVEDDVEGVKQLCGMGFSRTQAVTALESNAYDFQKALNSLLGG